VVVLEEDRDGYLLRRDPLFGHPRLDALPTAHPARRGGFLPIDPQQAVLYYALNSAAAESEATSGEAVQALPCLRGVHVEGVRRHGLV
jgi:hypothetical protein